MDRGKSDVEYWTVAPISYADGVLRRGELRALDLAIGAIAVSMHPLHLKEAAATSLATDLLVLKDMLFYCHPC